MNKKYLQRWKFAGDKESCNELFNLVKKGIKTATSYLYLNDRDLFQEEYSILTDYDSKEEILIKTTKIYKEKFINVTKEHAYKEGEGDRSLEYWKSIHLEFFTKELSSINLKFNDEIEIICEEFEIVKEKNN